MLSSILVIVGTVIGAGFASGKEIYTFFNIHGPYGLIGLLISISIIGVVIYKALKIIIQNNISSYSDFVNTISSRSHFINTIFCNVVNIFLAISFVVMVAGFSAYFAQEFNLHHIIGATIIAILSFIVFLKNIDGIVEINKLFIPFLILIILFLGFKHFNLFLCFEYYWEETKFNWIVSSLLYASYNLIVIIPILIGMKNYIKNLKHAKLISLLVCMFLFFVACTLFLLNNFYFMQIKSLDLPTIFIASNLGLFYKYICGIAILGAIFTTAISSGYGFLSNLSITNRKVYITVTIFMCLLSILLSNLGFSNLLNLLYPILGFIRIYTNNIYSIFCKNILKILHFIDINIMRFYI